MILEGFIQGTSDEELLKSLPTENISEDLVKAMNKVGLVQKEVQVKGKNGQTFTRKQWVRASDDKGSGDLKTATTSEEGSSKSNREQLTEKLKKKYGSKVTLGTFERKPNLDKGEHEAFEVKGYYKDDKGHVNRINEVQYIERKPVQPKQTASKDTAVSDSKSYSGDEAVDTVHNLKSGSVIEVTTKLKDGSTVTGEYTLQTKKYAIGTAEAWVKTGGNHYQGDFLTNKSTIKNTIGSTKDSVKIKKAVEDGVATHTKQAANSQNHFTGKSKDELWSNLKSAGYEVDSADKHTPQDKITLYKDKQEFTATFNKYSDRGVEVSNIKPAQTSTAADKKPSQSYTSTGDLQYNGQTISKIFKHGAYMYKVRGVKDLFGSQKQAKEYVDRHKSDQNTATQDKSKASMLEDYFADGHNHSDTKSALTALLGKGYSRQDIMSQAEKSGITWKKNDHEGINWMRASMAIQKAWKKG